MNEIEFRNYLWAWSDPRPEPLITEVSVSRGEPIEACIKFRIDGKQKFWPRLKMAARYFWYIASGKLQWAILAKFNP
jgi:hypothetical protein